MNVSRVVEIKMFDSQGLQTADYTIDVSSNLLSKKWPKQMYRVLRDAIQTCIQGGIVVMRGVLNVG